nr:zinc finger, CCHC-type [Tanacetum cinerariifolium]
MTNGESVKDMTNKFDKLAKFEGQDFHRWQKKMHFLLTTLKVMYVLSTPSSVWSENETLETTRKRMKWENNDYICRGHILNGMSNSLFDIYQNAKSVKALWESLESKYMAEDAFATKFLEGLKNQELDNNRKGKNQIGSSSVNMVERDGVKNSNNNKNKRKFKSGDDKFANKKGTITCWKCKKTAHVKKDCRSRKGNDGAGSDGSKDPEKQQGYNYDFMQNFVNVLHYVYVIFDAFYVQDDEVAWWVDSGATSHVCKDLSLDKFKIYKQEVELQRQDLIKVLRTNKGGEYYNPVYFQSTGIIHYPTTPYIPQQNRVAERKNMTLKEMVNSMLSYSGLSEGFWGEACYILNRALNKNSKQTPYEIWTKKVPNLTHLRIWGCRAVVRLTESKMKNLDEKGIDCIFIGYAEHSKCYRFYVIETNDYVSVNSIIESRDAIFDKERFTSIPRPRGFRQKERIDFFDTYALVARNSSIRLLLALAAIHDQVIHQMDVKTAFLNGDLDEEIYMKQHEGFVMPGHESKCMYSKFNASGKGVIICLYVEDMLIFSTDQDQVNKTNEFLSYKFDINDLGEAEVILGIRIKRGNNGTLVSQLEYFRAIGCLMYAMISTRPDIAFAVGKLSRYTSNLSALHWQALGRVFQYLKGTIDYGLTYSGYPSVIKGYSDASWINNMEDHSSTSGWVFLFRGGVISWASKKQTCITSSTIESEFVALAAASNEAE